MLEYKKFCDFANEPTVLDGSKITMANILNKEILIIGYRVATSKYNTANGNKYLTLHIELEGIHYILFTGSIVLIEQIEKYKDEIPFLTTIKQIDRYYTFS
jgi:hypothetical protein